MLSLRVLDVRDVSRPPPRRGYTPEKMQWAVQVTHGTQQHRTSFTTHLPSAGGREGGQGEKAPILWQELEITDRGEQETVEISLLFDLAPKATLGRQLYRHSTTTIEMRTFRAQPEKRIQLLQPLRSVASQVGADLGSIKLDVMYSDDGGDHGYLFALFCGLVSPTDVFFRQR